MRFFSFFSIFLSSFLSFLCTICAFSLTSVLRAVPEKQSFTLKLKPADGMVRAELKYWEAPENCVGALVLCPGWNGDGTHLINDVKWQQFAQKHKLLLVGLSFASTDEQNGYHHVAKGSGQVLFDGLGQIVRRELPIIVFGFSRGGQFAQNLAACFPERIRVWACTGSGPGEAFSNDTRGKPPGLVICGLEDSNVISAQSTFFAGLRAKWRICWLGVPRSGHQINPQAMDFTRAFFAAVLSQTPDCAGIWVPAEGRGMDGFLVNTWLPDETTLRAWKTF